jgi:hypothetical protein
MSATIEYELFARYFSKKQMLPKSFNIRKNEMENFFE